MSASLAAEIAQLHELFKLGALTQEEFQDAKQAAIRSFRAAPVTTGEPVAAATASHSTPSCASPPPPPQSPPRVPPGLQSAWGAASHEAAVEADARGEAEIDSRPPPPTSSAPEDTAVATWPRSTEMWRQLWDSSPVAAPLHTSASAGDALDARVQALRCLSRLLRNVQMYPAEPKYRVLRESNKVVAAELLPVAEPCAAVLRFAGFTREPDEREATAHCWVLPRSPDAAAAAAVAARRVARAVCLVDELLEYVGEQQSRRYGLQQLWRSVALEVRLERASRDAAAAASVLDVASDLEEAEEEEGRDDGSSATRTSPPPSPALLAYLVECYTVDEAGDGLYSSLQHLQTLQRLYETAAAAVAQGGGAADPSTASCSLLRTAEVYGAVVRQRGAVELLLYGCGARLPLPSTAALPATATTNSSSSGGTDAATTSSDYTLELIPPSVSNAAAFAARCLRLLRRVRREVERRQQERARAARSAAEVSMKQELRRERQRRQLEAQRGRPDAPSEGQHPRRRTHSPPHRRTHQAGSSSSSSSTSSRAGASTAEDRGSGGRRIPVAEALAILMGKRSPPARRPPAASSSSLS
ncbi:PUB domain containing protein [Novymonas esmeraldas]|uniref:PUB domain containing protein n=1 Tax=Novymonas esmeraldas TaxID=1808958 RepID=A0AAW0ELF3_9TRYP